MMDSTGSGRTLYSSYFNSMQYWVMISQAKDLAAGVRLGVKTHNGMPVFSFFSSASVQLPCQYKAWEETVMAQSLDLGS